MKFTIIGSGGCVALPKPFCKCRVCREAREKGKPYSRFGCSLYLEELKLLIDTPEDKDADILIIGNTFVGEVLKDGFILKDGNSLKNDLFSMNEIKELKDKYNIKKVVITHIEEDWGKSYDDYIELQKQNDNIFFAYDRMSFEV